MKITIVGTGYVGLVTGACFSEMGNEVTCVDNDQAKINNLQKGIIHIFEPGLENIVKKNAEKETLKFTTNLSEVLNQSNLVFIAVGTPMGEDGSADMKYVLSVAEEIGKTMQKQLIVVNKSTVPVGSGEKVKNVIQTALDKRGSDLSFSVVSNPEFLKEGTAIQDFMKPDRVVIGTEDTKAKVVLKQLYAPFCMSHNRIICMDIRSAEMTKYAANSMLATKISFMNEMAQICERIGADVNQVRIGIGSDSRIGYHFIYPGCGYGGSCFPKDVKALKKMAEDTGYKARIIGAVEEVNENQKYVIPNKIIKRFGEDLTGLKFGLWGLSFKPGTDDMRESPAIYLVKELTKRGAKIAAYDPKAMQEAQQFYLKNLAGISYMDFKYDALKNANAMILLTEWKEFRSPDFKEIKSLLSEPIIFDGRNQYNIFNLEEQGFEYYQIGKGSV